jgi:hypothetical protein
LAPLNSTPHVWLTNLNITLPTGAVMPSTSSLDLIIYRRLDDVSAYPPTKASARYDDDEDLTAPRPTKRPRSPDMDRDSGLGVISDDQQTPRPAKRRRAFVDEIHFSPTPSSRSDSAASAFSHKSGRLSPVKQIEALKDLERPVIFCDFDCLDAASGRRDVATMRNAAQTLADGVGILEYENEHVFNLSIAALPDLDKKRLQRPWARAADRALYGSTPAIQSVASIVDDACALNDGAGGAEEEWNSDIQKPLLKLALATSRHAKKLALHSV